MGGRVLSFEWEESFDEQQFRDVESLIETLGVTPNQAMDLLRVLPEKREQMLSKLMCDHHGTQSHRDASNGVIEQLLSGR